MINRHFWFPDQGITKHLNCAQVKRFEHGHCEAIQQLAKWSNMLDQPFQSAQADPDLATCAGRYFFLGSSSQQIWQHDQVEGINRHKKALHAEAKAISVSLLYAEAKAGIKAVEKKIQPSSA